VGHTIANDCNAIDCRTHYEGCARGRTPGSGQDVLVRAGVIGECDTLDVNEGLDDFLIEEVNDRDRAEVEAAAKEYAGSS
jgi:hypothetical protein